MSWGWQEWAVALLVAICVVRLGFGLCNFFRRVKRGGNPCNTCSCDCELRDLPRRHCPEHKERKHSANKKCCG